MKINKLIFIVLITIFNIKSAEEFPINKKIIQVPQEYQIEKTDNQGKPILDDQGKTIINKEEIDLAEPEAFTAVEFGDLISEEIKSKGVYNIARVVSVDKNGKTYVHYYDANSLTIYLFPKEFLDTLKNGKFKTDADLRQHLIRKKDLFTGLPIQAVQYFMIENLQSTFKYIGNDTQAMVNNDEQLAEEPMAAAAAVEEPAAEAAAQQQPYYPPAPRPEHAAAAQPRPARYFQDILGVGRLPILGELFQRNRNRNYENLIDNAINNNNNENLINFLIKENKINHNLNYFNQQNIKNDINKIISTKDTIIKDYIKINPKNYIEENNFLNKIDNRNEKKLDLISNLKKDDFFENPYLKNNFFDFFNKDKPNKKPKFDLQYLLDSLHNFRGYYSPAQLNEIKQAIIQLLEEQKYK